MGLDLSFSIVGLSLFVLTDGPDRLVLVIVLDLPIVGLGRTTNKVH